MEKGKKKKIGAVLVQGGGIAGVQASLDLANSGFKVYLVENSAAIGGMMAHLDKTFPTGDCATCIVSPKLVECARNLNIEILTLSKLEKLEGTPGNFKAYRKEVSPLHRREDLQRLRRLHQGLPGRNRRPLQPRPGEKESHPEIFRTGDTQ